MSAGFNPVLAYAAGALTILSPCVLPLVPVVLGSAAQGSKWGPAALSAGLVVSFTATGFALATLGTGLNGDALRYGGAAMLALIGLALLVPQAQHAFERAAGPLVGWANQRQMGLERFGLAGQAGIGALLGLVWSPCVGPTLGAATLLAAQGENLGQVALTMAAFGLGIASILLLIATAGRQVMARWRARMMQTGLGGRRVFGALLLVVGILIGTGLDRMIEAAFLSAAPDWLIVASTTI